MILRPRFLLTCTAAFLLAGLAHAEMKLALEDAVRLALEKNPQIKVQDYGRSIARADWVAAWGRFDPAIAFRRSYSEDGTPYESGTAVTAHMVKVDDYSLALEGATPWGLTYSIGGWARNQRYPGVGANNFADNFSTFGGVSITQPLLRGFGFGANLLGVRVAKADRKIADWEFRQTVIDTITNVVTAYSDVAYAEQTLRIAQRSRDLAAGLLKENERRFQVGSMSENDVTQARARTATRDEAILYAQQGVRDAVNRLRQLMGETSFPMDPEAIATEPPEIADDFPVQPAEDLKLAYDQRPDYQAARLGIYKSRANHLSARNQLLPQLDFVGSYGYNGLDRDFGVSRQMVRDQDSRSYSAGMVVRVPLTFTEGRGKARSAKLQLRQAEADLLRLEQDIALSIASAAGQIETTRRRVAANRAAYEYAKQALDDELKQLRAGSSSTFLVLQFQGELAGAENSLYRALADQRRAHAAYDRELGRTLAVHHVDLEKR